MKAEVEKVPNTDWVCWQCHVQNTDKKTKCVVCGAERRKEVVKKTSEAFVLDDKTDTKLAATLTTETTSDSSTIHAYQHHHSVILIILYGLGALMIILFILQCLSGFTLGNLLNQTIKQIDFVSLPSRIIEVFTTVWINGIKNLKNLQWEGPFMLAYKKCLQIPSWGQNAQSIIQHFDRFFIPLMFFWLVSHLISVWQDCANHKQHHIIWRCLSIFLVDFFLMTAVVLVPTNNNVSVTIKCLQGMLSLQTVVTVIAFMFSFFMFGRRKRLSSRNKHLDTVWYAFSTVVMYLTAVFVL